jgi:hypothetical protein
MILQRYFRTSDAGLYEQVLKGDPQNAAPIAAPNAQADEHATARPGDIKVSNLAQVPDDVKRALEGLELKQIHTTRGGELVARIGFVQSPTREITRSFRAGDEFKDDASPQAPWRLLAIDAETDRVLLRRSGHTLALRLFGEASGLSPQPEVSAAPAVPGELIVVTRSREDVARDLREAKVSEEEIAALMALLDKAPEPDAAAKLAEVAKPDADAGKRAPPAGLEGVLRLMAEQTKAAKESPPAPPDQPKPE